MHEWADEHKWFDNHFWERPMNPKRFEESSCIKCHVNVTELAVNPKFGPTAPKVARGHRLVETYGCFGCHEIQGFEATKIIGPDLRLEPNTPEEADAIAADPNQVAGKMRKVGPSLRHLALKVDAGFVASWTEEPKRFRPTTRMPQFFKLDNQSDVHGQKFNPVEIAAITHYLLAKSTEFQQNAANDDQLAYKPLARLLPDSIPSAERGKEFFATKGCVNCHTHDAVKGLDMTFGPELSNVHEKLKAGDFGFDWLYTWVREPSRYHPRTRMPAQPLEVEKVDGVDTDPAADIAASAAASHRCLRLLDRNLGARAPAARADGASEPRCLALRGDVKRRLWLPAAEGHGVERGAALDDNGRALKVKVDDDEDNADGLRPRKGSVGGKTPRGGKKTEDPDEDVPVTENPMRARSGHRFRITSTFFIA